MCGPVAPILALAAAGVSAVGKGVSAVQSAATYRYQAKIADRNVQLDNEAAQNSIQTGKTEALQRYRKIGAVEGQQLAAMAANGVDLGSGSALQVQEDTAALGAEDVSQGYKQEFERTRGFEISAANDRAKAQAARQAATGAIVGGMFDVVSTALGGASQFTKLKAGV